MRSRLLTPAFYQQGAVAVARGLLGCVLARSAPEGTASGVIVETEAYAGRTDAACHSFKLEGPRPGHRTEVMFRPGGLAYVYLIYGMYCCFNVTCAPAGRAEAVLVRALAPLEGKPLMRTRRGTEDERKLCSGPGKLCMALAVTREQNGADLRGETLRILQGNPIQDAEVVATPRINVDYAGEDAALPYRFAVKDSPFLSTRRFLKAALRKERFSGTTP